MKKLVALVLILVLSFGIASAELVFWTESGERVNVRDKPYGGAVLCRFSSGTPLPSGSHKYSGDRYAIPLSDGRTGYVYSALVKNGIPVPKSFDGFDVVHSDSKANSMYVVPSQGANIRSRASLDSSQIGYAPYRARVTILGQTGSWYVVSYKGTYGYIWRSLLSNTLPTSPAKTETFEKTVTVISAKRVNLRSRPSLDGNIRGLVDPGDILTLVRYVSTNWAEVIVNGNHFYIHRNCIK